MCVQRNSLLTHYTRAEQLTTCSTNQLGNFDSPPATAAESSTPETRRGRLHQAIQDTRDLAPDSRRLAWEDQTSGRITLPALPTPTSGARRHVYMNPSSTTSPATTARRRPRPPSEHPDEVDNDHGSSTSSTAAHVNGTTSRRRRTRRSSDERGDRKRRKLAPITSSPPPGTPHRPINPIKYGYHGQVVPGRLQLELISCDGGEHRDPLHPDTRLDVDNILRHDRSVYCSERPEANVVLRHRDRGTPFCLERLWVVGPEGGFTAP